MQQPIRQKFDRPDRSGFPNIRRFNLMYSRYRRMMVRKKIVGPWRLLCRDLIDYVLRRFPFGLYVVLKLEERRLRAKYDRRHKRLS
jgi:hypothetical protein